MTLTENYLNYNTNCLVIIELSMRRFWDICCAFFRRQEFNFPKNWDKENFNMNRKIKSNLQFAKFRTNKKNLNSITYSIAVTEPLISLKDFVPVKINKINKISK